jgi:hypothetical protein
VRLSDAHLFLPPYAALPPRARYAASYLGGDYGPPGQPLQPPGPPATEEDLNAYLKQLGPDPVLPFVVPTLGSEGTPTTPVTFFVPARYSRLLDNARLLAGNLTVVGKVPYLDSRLPDDEACIVDDDRESSPCSYFDRQAFTTFSTALRKAQPSVLRTLRIRRRGIVGMVRASLTFRTPIVVVLPVAIYQ